MQSLTPKTPVSSGSPRWVLLYTSVFKDAFTEQFPSDFRLLRSQPTKFSDRLEFVDAKLSAFISRLGTWGSECRNHCCAFCLVHLYGIEVLVEQNNEYGIPLLRHVYGSNALSRLAVRQDAAALYL